VTIDFMGVDLVTSRPHESWPHGNWPHDTESTSSRARHQWFM